MIISTEYKLTTIWLIPAPIKLIWLYIVDTEKWPQWWPNVAAVQTISTGNESGKGNVANYRWHTCLPYSLGLNLRVVDVQPYRQIKVEVDGDLKGLGICNLTWDETQECTVLEFLWHVEPCKFWLKLFTICAKPVATWNHNRVMKRGELGLVRHLAATSPSL